MKPKLIISFDLLLKKLNFQELSYFNQKKNNCLSNKKIHKKMNRGKCQRWKKSSLLNTW